jgi:hypothetical protein
MFCVTSATSCTSDTPTMASGRITMNRQIASVASAAALGLPGILRSSHL